MILSVRPSCGAVLLTRPVSRTQRWMLAFALLSFALPVRPATDPGSAEGEKAADSGDRASSNKPAESSDHELIEQLLAQIEALNARVVELEWREAGKPAEDPASAPPAASPRALNAAFLAAPPLAGLQRPQYRKRRAQWPLPARTRACLPNPRTGTTCRCQAAPL